MLQWLHRYLVYTSGYNLVKNENVSRLVMSTLCDSVDRSCQTPLSMGILQARILELVTMPFSMGSSQPRD